MTSAHLRGLLLRPSGTPRPVESPCDHRTRRNSRAPLHGRAQLLEVSARWAHRWPLPPLRVLPHSPLAPYGRTATESDNRTLTWLSTKLLSPPLAATAGYPQDMGDQAMPDEAVVVCKCYIISAGLPSATNIAVVTAMCCRCNCQSEPAPQLCRWASLHLP